MNTGQKFTVFGPGLMAMVLTASSALAQVPVDDGGNVIGTYQDPTSAAGTGNEGIPLLTRQELQDLVGPVALYPDDLLAIVLPAATYPLQVVQASRFLEELESNPGLEPDADWDDAIVALLNYPEIVELLNEDLDWTWRLGEAVVAQQTDVVNAVEAFRNTAYAAGNLRSDDYQQVSRDEGVIEITPLNDDIIYVPYYEPESVVVYQPRPVYFYYERPRPVYYYPYADTYAFHSGFFWGVTTAFTIAWASDSLHVYHHSYYGHPYYGHHYRTRWWYRQPSIYTHNTIYRGGNHYRASNWHSRGDYWRSSRNRHLRHSDQRVTRNRQYTNRNVQHAVTTTRSHTSTFRAVATANQHTARRQTQSRSESRHETRYVARNEPRQQTRPSTRSEPRHQTRPSTRSEPRNEARHVARNEPRRESHSEARHEPQRASQNHERREQRSANQQSRGREQPRRSKH
ncbi:MAG: DUF3300 domain-containing protein [Proteobacteria bacterium]|nr:DUF3300 domain-containing protein [Pseudomonadota bacterium]